MNVGIYSNSPNSPTSNSIRSLNGVSAPVSISVLAIGGGGSGGGSQNVNTSGGGGGAGSMIEELIFNVALNTAYTIVIGAGAASNGTPFTGLRGNYSRFGHIICHGGGAGFYNSSQTGFDRTISVCTGGANNGLIPTALFGGFSGGTGGGGAAGGGGGMGGSGITGTSGVAGAGGAGLVSAITLETLAGGGGGGLSVSGTVGSGNNGGGNGGSTTVAATNGASNSGGGGGGSGFGSTTATRSGGAGGSGKVVLQFNNALVATLSVGLVHSSTYNGSLRTLTITGGTGTITFS